jgi:hypothetical protein
MGLGSDMGLRHDARLRRDMRLRHDMGLRYYMGLRHDVRLRDRCGDVGLRDRRRNVRRRRRRRDVWWGRGRCRADGRRSSSLIPPLLRGGIGRERRQDQHQHCRGAKTGLSHCGDSQI